MSTPIQDAETSLVYHWPDGDALKSCGIVDFGGDCLWNKVLLRVSEGFMI